MKTNRFGIILSALALVITGCSGNDDAQGDLSQKNNSNPNAIIFTSDNSTDGASLSKQGVPLTRTSIVHTNGAGATAFWSTGDKIWVEDNAGVFHQSNAGTLNANKSRGTFELTTGTYNNGCQVNYVGNSSDANKVTIASAQTQILPNDFSHAGESGDCGVATASGSGQAFSFSLAHKAAYLCIYPRCENVDLGKNIYLKKITIESNNTIAGTYDFSSAGLAASPSSNASNSIVLTTGTGNGVKLNNTLTEQSNSFYVVIAPGTHQLTMKYTLFDPATNVSGEMEKTVNIAASVNSMTDITANLTPTNYNNEYYTWDAAVGQHYWKGYEWNNANAFLRQQPTVSGTANAAYAPLDSPESVSNPRGYRDDTGHARPYPDANRSAKDDPNINECLWYCLNGDPHWDGETLWSTMGHLYAGGMWFLKKNKIVGFSSTIAPDGQDYRYHYERKENTNIPQTKPSNTADYFYLPAFGFYESGLLYYVGQNANYWSRSAYLIQDNRAYDLGFKHDVVAVNFNESYKDFSLFKGE